VLQQQLDHKQEQANDLLLNFTAMDHQVDQVGGTTRPSELVAKPALHVVAGDCHWSSGIGLLLFNEGLCGLCWWCSLFFVVRLPVL